MINPCHPIKLTLHELRVRNGLSMDDLARRVGCGKSSVHDYESGERSPSTAMARRFAAALNVDAEALVVAAELARLAPNTQRYLAALEQDLMIARDSRGQVEGSARLQLDGACHIQLIDLGRLTRTCEFGSQIELAKRSRHSCWIAHTELARDNRLGLTSASKTHGPYFTKNDTLILGRERADAPPANDQPIAVSLVPHASSLGSVAVVTVIRSEARLALRGLNIFEEPVLVHRQSLLWWAPIDAILRLRPVA